MGIVYKARDTKLDRDVALKVKPDSRNDRAITPHFGRAGGILPMPGSPPDE